jgi:hypothetical protein
MPWLRRPATTYIEQKLSLFRGGNPRRLRFSLSPSFARGATAGACVPNQSRWGVGSASHLRRKVFGKPRPHQAAGRAAVCRMRWNWLARGLRQEVRSEASRVMCSLKSVPWMSSVTLRTYGDNLLFAMLA